MKKADEMTDQELRSSTQDYDNIQNEGGEGYNPYRSEMERREHEATINQPKSKQDKIDALYNRINRECGSVAREWGNNAEIDAKQTDIYKEISSLKAEIEADFIADWPIELTKTRRIEWNDFIKNTIGTGKVGPNESRAIYKKQGDQGWMMADLKKAVKHHKL